jgi:pimeloyl-ACP methyl ester carboxylesterase
VPAPTLSLTRSGSGEPLLLLHGMGSSRRDFTAVAPALAERFEVLAVDLPGIGGSRHLDERPTVAAIADAVERTLDAAGLDTVHVLGNSLGARVALELAVRGRARSVVAVAPSGMNLPPERLYQAGALALARVGLRLLDPLLERLSGWRVGRAGLLGPLKASPWLTSEEEALGARDGFADSRDFWRTLLWGLLLDLPRGTARIECPVTLVQGTADWIASGQTVRYLPLVPGARFRPLLAAGHAPQSDRPATVVRIVERTVAARPPLPPPSGCCAPPDRSRGSRVTMGTCCARCCSTCSAPSSTGAAACSTRPGRYRPRTG